MDRYINNVFSQYLKFYEVVETDLALSIFKVTE